MIRKVAAILSLILFATAVVTTSLPPINGYELSIYSVASVGFIAIGAMVAVGGSLSYLRQRKYQHLASCIITVAIVLVASMPLLRGYWYFGGWDAITHLGYAIDLSTNQVSLRLLMYPGLHSFAATVSKITGLTINRALLTVTVSFVLLFVMSVTAAGSYFGQSNRSVGIVTLFAAWLSPILAIKLPVLQPVPTTVSILFSSFVVFTAVKLLDAPSRRVKVVLLLAVLSQLFYHPEFFAGTILGLLTIGFVLDTWVFKLYTYQQKLGTIALIAVSLLILWMLDKPFGYGLAITVAQGLLEPTDTTGVASSVSAVSSVGSISHLFFQSLVTKVVLILATITAVVASGYRIWTKRGNSTDRIVVAVGAGAAILVIPFSVMYVVGLVNQATRFLGLGLAFATVAFGIWVVSDQRFTTSLNVRRLLIAVALVGALWSIPAVYQSPSVYQPNPHVSESSHAGYGWIIENRADRMSIGSLRHQVPRRYEAHVGRLNGQMGDTVPPTESLLANLSQSRGENYYLPYDYHERGIRAYVTDDTCLGILEEDRQTDVVLYNGRRFTSEDYEIIFDRNNVIYQSDGAAFVCG